MNARDPSVAGLLRPARQHGFDLHPIGPDVDTSGSDFLVAHAADDAGVVIADFARLSGDDEPMQLAQAMVEETLQGMG